jgi:hypothetical protein
MDMKVVASTRNVEEQIKSAVPLTSPTIGLFKRYDFRAANQFQKAGTRTPSVQPRIPGEGGSTAWEGMIRQSHTTATLPNPNGELIDESICIACLGHATVLNEFSSMRQLQQTHTLNQPKKFGGGP